MDVVEESVDREVPPAGVGCRIAEDVVLADQQVGGIVVKAIGGGPERRDVQHVALKGDVHQPEAAADDPAVSEQALDLARPGVGHDVEVLGRHPEEEVPDASPDEVGHVAVALEAPDDLHSVRIQIDGADGLAGADPEAAAPRSGPGGGAHLVGSPPRARRPPEERPPRTSPREFLDEATTPPGAAERSRGIAVGPARERRRLPGLQGRPDDLGR